MANMWRAGAAEVDISTVGPLTGYLLRTKKCERVEHLLFVKALAFQDLSANEAVIVTLDVCGIDHALSEMIFADIMSETHLKRDQIILNCLHTHCGHAVAGYLPTLFAYNKADADQIKSFTDSLRAAIVKVVAQALNSLEFVEWFSGSTSAYFGSCRRVLDADRHRWIGFGDDPAGPSDSQVPVLVLKRKSDASVLSLLFGYACHPTAATEECLALNADYVGYALQHLKKQLSDRATILFVQLCGGDQNPKPRGGPDAGLQHAAQHGAALAKSVLDLLAASSASSLTPVTPSLSRSFLEIRLETEPVTRARLEEDLLASRVPNECFVRRATLALQSSSNDRSYVKQSISYPISVLKFGAEFLFVALADEVVVRYALRLKEAIGSYSAEQGTLTTMVAGYCSEVSCYIPDAQMQSEGGYEPQESCVYYGLPSSLSRDTEMRVFGAVTSALGSVGVQLKFPELPVTERPNSLTLKMDLASAAEFVQMVHAAEKQIFTGYDHLPGISDVSSAEHILRASEVLQEVLNASEDQRTAVVIAGCGTSGRLAWQMALLLREHFPKAAKLNRINYLMAAGDTALVVGSELVEDDMEIAAADLKRVLDSVNSPHRVMYIGVTCGVSAPYVASHLNLLSLLPDSVRFHALLIGFNPPHLARDVPIEGSNETFRSILMKCIARSNTKGSSFVLQILTPIIGPEPLTGSSRMKGGSATLVLLHALVAGSLFASPSSSSAYDFVRKLLKRFEDGLDAVARSANTGLADAIDAAGDTLRAGHRIRYAALDAAIGVLALIDASEMVSTFGATVDSTRAFVADGWKRLHTHSGGEAIAQHGDAYQIDLDRLEKHLNEGDLLFVIVSERSGSEKEALAQIIDIAKKRMSKIGLIALHQSTNFFDSLRNADVTHYVSICMPDAEIVANLPSAEMLAIKSALNLISTGAFVRFGKVISNRMVDVSVSNNKLWFRALWMISHFGKCDTDTARRCLLRSIYLRDNIDSVLDTPLSTNIALASQQHGGVVPRAILLALRRTSVADASSILKAEPQVSKAIAVC